MQLVAQESQGDANFARYADDMPCGAWALIELENEKHQVSYEW